MEIVLYKTRMAKLLATIINPSILLSMKAETNSAWEIHTPTVQGHRGDLVLSIRKKSGIYFSRALQKWIGIGAENGMRVSFASHGGKLYLFALPKAEEQGWKVSSGGTIKSDKVFDLLGKQFGIYNQDYKVTIEKQSVNHLHYKMFRIIQIEQ